MKLAGWNANTTGAPRKSESVTGDPVCDVKVKSGAISPGLIAMSNTIQSTIGDHRQNCKHTPLTPAGVATRCSAFRGVPLIVPGLCDNLGRPSLFMNARGLKAENDRIGNLAAAFMAGEGDAHLFTGRRKVTVAPCPGPSLSMVIVPPWASTMAWVMANPRPVPPLPRLRDWSVR